MGPTPREWDDAMQPFWPPLKAGVLLGLALLFTFVLSGHGLGASGAMSHVVAWAAHLVEPAAARAHAYLGPMLAPSHPLDAWITWEVLGVGLGALAAAFLAGRWRVRIDGTASATAPWRIARALAGGVLAGFGARVSAGCTSGLGLSGAATLAVAAFVFLGLFFAVGLAVSRLMKEI